MKQRSLILALAVIFVGTVSCEKIGDGDLQNNPYKELDFTTKSSDYVSKGNDFAFNFIHRVNNTASNEDYVISPLSMQFLLGMLLEGAKGQTADEICDVLGYGSGEVGAVNEYCLSMMRQLPNLDKKTKLAIANAIVVNKKYPLLDSYKTTVSNYYEAEVTNMDFSDNSGTTRRINQWCSAHTNGLVPEIIKNVDSQMVSLLMNAMYFKSQWKEIFPAINTSKESFTNESGVKKTVPMMKNSKKFEYQCNEVFRAVRLPYGNGAFSMMVILPVEGKTLKDVTSHLNENVWSEFVKSMVNCVVNLWLPKFETNTHMDLNDILSTMGMPSAFDPIKADFKAMSNNPMFLSLVKQDAVIKVDEEGAEAAVVSSAKGEMANAPGDHVFFHADQPFLYLITESSTGAIIFAGKYNGQ